MCHQDPIPERFRQKIQEAKEQHLEELDLSDGQLTKIPDEVFELTHLKVLNLSFNKIYELPDFISNLSNLTTLGLVKNQLSILPDSIGHLSNLTTLGLVKNQLSILPDSIGHLSNLTTLYLNENQLSILPDSIGNLFNLTTLGLSGNRLITLPESIGNLSNLITLTLSGNRLVILPDSLCNLSNLKKLSLVENKLSKLPSSLGNLSNLVTLYLNKNQLSTLPDSLGNLSNLVALYLNENHLSILPDSLCNLSNLKELGLVKNQLSILPDFIGKFSNLKELNLVKNQLSILPDSIGNLSNLTTLYLNENHLSTLPDSLGNLSNLTTLGLSGNQLSTLPNSLGNLSNLTTLGLSGNQLSTLPNSLGNLSNLTTLGLVKNKLSTLPDSLGNLFNLRELYLTKNQLSSLPNSFGNLSNLTKLELNHNKLSTIPDSIGNLSNLSELGLRNNQLSKIAYSFSKLSNLTKLDLSFNNLNNISDSFSNITNVNTLDLSYNKLSKLPDYFSSLRNLSKLYLKHNRLHTIPNYISQLSNLIELDLSYNKLTVLPDFLSDLNQLQELHLGYNQIVKLPDFSDNLTSLKKLHLHNNKLTMLPDSIGKLVNLTYLSLMNNRLNNLPNDINNLSKLTDLSLDNNTLETPPIEVAEKGIEAIRDYFRQLKQGTDYIYEAKLLIVGEAGAGKTSFAKKIENQNYQLRYNEKSTEGIEVTKWSFLLDNQRKFTVNIWDFGGQEIYHATHQFFLTKRSLYTLVVDNRKEDDNLYYWLNVVRLLSNSSPLLIINNKKQNRSKEVPEQTLRGEFKNLLASLATDLSNNHNLHNIIDNIKFYIKQLPHIGQKLPKTWVKVRQILESNSRNHISLNEYFKICQKHGFTQLQDKLQLSQYLHDLGVCLHFQDNKNSLLYKTVILKPQWATDAVYKVLDNQNVINHQGCFSYADLENIWQESYYADMQGELLALMMKFQLCYPVPYSDDTFVAPQLLSQDQPHYDWDHSHNLILRYTYPAFMPKGILSRFIVVMHPWIESIGEENKVDKQQSVWRTGVVLNKENTRAEIIEFYGKREIAIRVSGKLKRDLMTQVTYELDKINNSYNRLKYQKLIPCNCPACKNSQNPHTYQYHKLLERFANQKLTIECGNPPYHEIQVFNLIDNAIDIRQLISKDKQDSNKSINFDGNIQQLVFQLLEQGNISGDFMTGDHTTNQSRNLSISDNAQVTASGAGALSLGNISGTVANTINQLPTSPDPDQPGIKELLIKLSEAISISEDLDEKRKTKAFKQIEALATAAQNPTNENMKESAEDATTMLEGIVSKLPAAAALVTICQEVLPAIAHFFGHENLH